MRHPSAAPPHMADLPSRCERPSPLCAAARHRAPDRSAARATPERLSGWAAALKARQRGRGATAQVAGGRRRRACGGMLKHLQAALQGALQGAVRSFIGAEERIMRCVEGRGSAICLSHTLVARRALPCHCCKAHCHVAAARGRPRAEQPACATGAHLPGDFSSDVPAVRVCNQLSERQRFPQALPCSARASDAAQNTHERACHLRARCDCTWRHRVPPSRVLS